MTVAVITGKITQQISVKADGTILCSAPIVGKSFHWRPPMTDTIAREGREVA